MNAMCCEYDLLVERSFLELQIVNYRDVPLSSAEERIRNEFAPDSSDPILNPFCTFVDEICYEAVRACFGSFVEIAGPILRQVQLAKISHRFKTDLPS
jgi:hypothetical protein